MGGVFVDPAGMDLVDRNGVEEVSFDAAVALRGYQTCFFQDVQVFCDAEPCHFEVLLQFFLGESLFGEQPVEQHASRGIRQGLENLVHVHPEKICDLMVTCQGEV